MPRMGILRRLAQGVKNDLARTERNWRQQERELKAFERTGQMPDTSTYGGAKMLKAPYVFVRETVNDIRAYTQMAGRAAGRAARLRSKTPAAPVPTKTTAPRRRAPAKKKPTAAPQAPRMADKLTQQVQTPVTQPPAPVVQRSGFYNRLATRHAGQPFTPPSPKAGVVS